MADLGLTWTKLKSLIIDGGLPYRFLDNGGGFYRIFAVDNPFQYECLICQDGGPDQLDFEANFKDKSDISIAQIDVDGAEIVRVKAAKKGWTYGAISTEFTTSVVGGNLYCKLSDGKTNRGWGIISTYDIDNNIVTTPDPGDNSINNTIVKTVLDFEPNVDYEIIGGELRTAQTITGDLRLWIIAAPDVPASVGGSKEMAGGINLKYLTPGNVYSVDGRVTKLLSYNATFHTSKIRLILLHPPGLQEQLSIVFEIYRQ